MSTKKEKAEIVFNILNREFPDPGIPLQHEDPYTLLIAVLLSAQCTDERVNKITPLLFAKAKTPQEMVKLKVQTIEDIIRPCGLAPRKALSIWQLSKILIDSYKAEVPQSFEALEALPGVGHKTASVVMAQAFGVAAFPVDTHIHRCAKRWGLSSGKNVVVTEKDLKLLFKEEHWNKLHLQIIYYGRKYCGARACDGKTCELCQLTNKTKKKARA
jgi:endonuclease III